MDDIAFQRRVDEVKRRAHGRWTSILATLGISEKVLNGRNQPCPMPGCGGTDRFQYTDKFGEGNFFCRSCGAGGGLKLAQHVMGIPFGELIVAIERHVGAAAALPGRGTPSPEAMKALALRIWEEARPVTTGDEVDRYLRNRGLQLTSYPRTLRFHPCLGNYEKSAGSKKSRKIGEYPAMLGCVQSSDGHAVTLHRTYLQGGCKALGGQSKKNLSSGISGAAVRLHEPTNELAITEGIENGLAVHLATGKPVWVALNCGNLDKLWVPDSVERVSIYGDNDSDSEFAGQVAAYALAQRLVKDAKKRGLAPRTVQVFLPRQGGVDWSDIWLARLVNQKKAA